METFGVNDEMAELLKGRQDLVRCWIVIQKNPVRDAQELTPAVFSEIARKSILEKEQHYRNNIEAKKERRAQRDFSNSEGSESEEEEWRDSGSQEEVEYFIEDFGADQKAAEVLRKSSAEMKERLTRHEWTDRRNITKQVMDVIRQGGDESDAGERQEDSQKEDFVDRWGLDERTLGTLDQQEENTQKYTMQNFNPGRFLRDDWQEKASAQRNQSVNKMFTKYVWQVTNENVQRDQGVDMTGIAVS